MNKFYFILLLCLFSSCRINKTNHVETCKTENDSTEQFYDQSEGMEILDTLGKVYGNEPHIAGLSLKLPTALTLLKVSILIKLLLFFRSQEIQSKHGRYWKRLPEVRISGWNLWVVVITRKPSCSLSRRS